MGKNRNANFSGNYQCSLFIVHQCTSTLHAASSSSTTGQTLHCQIQYRALNLRKPGQFIIEELLYLKKMCCKICHLHF